MNRSDYNIRIIKEKEKDMNASKNAMGVRCRFDPTQVSFAELEAECDYWSNQLRRDGEQEKRQEEEALKAYMQYAPDEEAARRWMQM